MNILTRHLVGRYVVQVIGRQDNGGRTLIEATVKPNSRIEIGTPNLIAMTVDDWRDLVIAINSAIDYVEFHAGRQQLSGITPHGVTTT